MKIQKFNYKENICFFLIYFTLFVHCYQAIISIENDLTLISFSIFADGLGRVSLSIFNLLKNDLKINFIPTRDCQLSDLPPEFQHIITTSSKEFASYVLFADVLSNTVTSKVPDIPQDRVRLAFSMLESNQIPKHWVNILNNKFDAVIVPSKFLIDVYESSGVNIPVFCLPLKVHYEKIMERAHKTANNIIKHKPFTFGMSAYFADRKNHALLLDAFISQFGKNNPQVAMRIHGRDGVKSIIKKLKSKIKKNKLTNVDLIVGPLSQDAYIEWLLSLDCFALISKGEGFSFTPYEALSAGIPCILTDNTAHKPLCSLNLVRCIPANIKVQADYKYAFGKKTFCGYQYDCKIGDVKKALSDVYLNYQHYKNLAKKGMEYVTSNFNLNHLRTQYLSFFKPQFIKLEKNNRIADSGIYTKSVKFYNKMRTLIK